MVINKGKINQFVILFPRLFGARRLTLNRVNSNDDMTRLVEFLRELGAIKVGESVTICDELNNFYFKIDGKWLVLICPEYQSPKLIAPKTLLKAFAEKFA